MYVILLKSDKRIFNYVEMVFFSKWFYEQPAEVRAKVRTFVQNGQNMVPIFQLGDAFQFQFDDLQGSEYIFYYHITLVSYTHLTMPTNLRVYIPDFKLYLTYNPTSNTALPDTTAPISRHNKSTPKKT